MMMDLSGYLQSVLKLGFRSSALAPLLWLNALISLPCFVASFVIPSDFRWAPFAVGCVVVVFTLSMFLSLKKINPRLLGSERFQVEMQTLDIVAQKGGPILFDTVNLPLSSDPKRISSPMDSEKEGDNE